MLRYGEIAIASSPIIITSVFDIKLQQHKKNI